MCKYREILIATEHLGTFLYTLEIYNDADSTDIGFLKCEFHYNNTAETFIVCFMLSSNCVKITHAIQTNLI